jgi:flap endonuclease-1
VGVDLGDVAVKRPADWAELSGRTVVVDAYNALYQFLATIRQADGTPLLDEQGRVTSHLNGLFNRTANLVGAGILPVYVFDGIPHALKRATIELRSQVKERARAAYEAALKAGDLATARSKAQQTSSLTGPMVQQAKRLLGLLGLPVVDAPSEGEAQASWMVQRGQAYAVASQDYDAILFGAPRLLRNLSVTGRRKLPGRSAWVEVQPEQIALAETLDALRLSREQLIDAALLIGTDYNPGVGGIGPKTGLELVREHGSLEALLEKAETAQGAVWRKLRDGQDGLGEFETVRNLFLHPHVADVPAPVPGRLDEAGVRSMLVEDHRFNPERVESALAKYRVVKAQREQRSLGDWG